MALRDNAIGQLGASVVEDGVFKVSEPTTTAAEAEEADTTGALTIIFIIVAISMTILVFSVGLAIFRYERAKDGEGKAEPAEMYNFVQDGTGVPRRGRENHMMRKTTSGNAIANRHDTDGYVLNLSMS